MPKSKDAAANIAKDAVHKASPRLDESRLGKTRYRTGTLENLLRDALLAESLTQKEETGSSLRKLSVAAQSNVATALFNSLADKRATVTDNKGKEKDKQLLKIRGGTTRIDGTILDSLKTDAAERDGILTHRHGDFSSTAETLKTELRIRAIADSVIAGLEADGRKVNRMNVTSTAKIETGKTISDVISPILKQSVNLAHTTGEETANLSKAITGVIVRATPEAHIWNNITADTVIKLKDHYAQKLTEEANKPSELQIAINTFHQRQIALQQPRIEAAPALDIQPSAPLRSASPEEKKYETSVHLDSPRNAAQAQSRYEWPERAAPALPPRPSKITPAAIKSQAEAKTAEHSR